MEADPGTKPLFIENEQKEIVYDFSNDSNVRKPIRIRRYSVDADQLNRFLVESQLCIVLPCGIILWIVFLLFG